MCSATSITVKDEVQDKGAHIGRYIKHDSLIRGLADTSPGEWLPFLLIATEGSNPT